MRPKKFLLFAFLTNLMCFFPFGHAAIPLGIFEPVLFMETISQDNGSPQLYIFSAASLLLGQILTVIGLRQKSADRLYVIGFMALLLLSTSVVLITYILNKQVPAITIFTGIPFIITSILFFITSSNNMMNKK